MFGNVDVVDVDMDVDVDVVRNCVMRLNNAIICQLLVRFNKFWLFNYVFLRLIMA